MRKGTSSRKTKTVAQVCNDIIKNRIFGFQGVELGSLQSALQNFVRFYIMALCSALTVQTCNIGFTANLLIGYVADLFCQCCP